MYGLWISSTELWRRISLLVPESLWVILARCIFSSFFEFRYKDKIVSLFLIIVSYKVNGRVSSGNAEIWRRMTKFLSE